MLGLAAHMAATRRMQMEVEKLLKKVKSSLDAFSREGHGGLARNTAQLNGMHLVLLPGCEI